MAYRIFISSVQKGVAKKRKALAGYIGTDAILGRFFDVFLFEAGMRTEMAKAPALSVESIVKILAKLKVTNFIFHVGDKRFGGWEILGQEPFP